MWVCEHSSVYSGAGPRILCCSVQNLYHAHVIFGYSTTKLQSLVMENEGQKEENVYLQTMFLMV